MDGAMELVTKSAAELARLLATREISARELVEAHLDRIAAVDGEVSRSGQHGVHAFLHVAAVTARDHAVRVDERRALGDELWVLACV